MASSQQSSGSSFSGIDNPEAFGLLMDFIRQSANGGSDDYKEQRARRTAATQDLQRITSDYSGDAAMRDAAALMQLNLQQSLEKNMPAIQRATQGAGTSASSMQGLLSGKIATDTALNAAALGTETKSKYGNILGGLHGTIEEFTRIDDTNARNLIGALTAARINRESHSSSSNTTDPISSGGSSGGGSRGGGGEEYSRAAGGWSNAGVGQRSPIDRVDAAAFWGGGGDEYYADEPFYYDDWGTGSNGYGDMAANNSAYSINPMMDYTDDWWDTAPSNNFESFDNFNDYQGDSDYYY